MQPGVLTDSFNGVITKSRKHESGVLMLSFHAMSGNSGYANNLIYYSSRVFIRQPRKRFVCKINTAIGTEVIFV
jgi:hypothetical protein